MIHARKKKWIQLCEVHIRQIPQKLLQSLPTQILQIQTVTPSMPIQFLCIRDSQKVMHYISRTLILLFKGIITTPVKSLNILDHILLGLTLLLKGWQHHSWLWNRRDWCPVQTRSDSKFGWRQEADLHSWMFAQSGCSSYCGCEYCWIMGKMD